MKNNIYEMLNNKNFNFDEYERLDFNDVENRKIKNNLRVAIKTRVEKYKKCATAAVSVLALGILFFNAEIGVEAFETIKGSIERILETQESLDNYKAVIDGSVVDQGIEIKVSEAILDEDKLYIYSQIRSSKRIKDDERYFTLMDAYINGEKAEFGRIGEKGDKIDDYIMEKVNSYELKNIDELDLSGDVNIKIVYRKAALSFIGDEPKYREGNWEFNFETNIEELQNRTKQGEVDCKFTLENGTNVILDSYKINPLGATIYGKMENAEHKEPYIISLKGVDNLGNEYNFGCSGNSAHIEMESKKINLKSKYIKLTPYAMKFPENNEKPEEEVKVGEEFVIYLK